MNHQSIFSCFETGNYFFKTSSILYSVIIYSILAIIIKSSLFCAFFPILIFNANSSSEVSSCLTLISIIFFTFNFIFNKYCFYFISFKSSHNKIICFAFPLSSIIINFNRIIIWLYIFKFKTQLQSY